MTRSPVQTKSLDVCEKIAFPGDETPPSEDWSSLNGITVQVVVLMASTTPTMSASAPLKNRNEWTV
jgi:hypothetical protein